MSSIDTQEAPARVAEVVVIDEDYTLRAVDQCHCGSRAYVQAFFEGGTDLLFCARDYRMNKDKIHEQAVLVRDETAHLLERPKGDI